MSELVQLADLLQEKNDQLVAQWRRQVEQLPSARHLDAPSIVDHVPALLRELAQALRKEADVPIADAACPSSPAHGLQRAEAGFDIVEVVAEYNILRDCINDLAESHGMPPRGRAVHILNRVIDAAIGMSVQTFATQRALEVQRRREEHLAFVAHDLRTPLAAISMAARVLEAALPALGVGPELDRMLKTLNRNSAHLGNLVADVLKESADLETEVGVKLERRRFDLWPLVEGLIHELRPISGTNTTRLVNSVPDDLVVRADASLLTRIFQNLIANAIAHTPRGEVVIGADSGGGDVVECWVRDNGIGIARRRLATIFEKFETGRPGQSFGLGLAIVKTFVEAHGGTISVASQEGVGTRFHFTLPGQAGEPVSGTTAAPAPDGDRG